MKPSKVCAAMLCGVFGAALFTTPALAAAAPNDLRHHWAQTQVYTLMEHGIIAGYSDHTFRPDQPVTRQEAAGLVYGLLEEMGVELDDEAEIPVFGGTTEDIPQQVLEDWEKYHNSLQRPSEPEEGEEETTIPGDDVMFPPIPTWTTAGQRTRSCVWRPTACCLRTAPACSVLSRT